MQDLIRSTLEDLSYFHPWPDENGTIAIPYVWQPGEVPLCLVLGPNGSGKSFFRRLVRLIADEDWKGVEFMHLSMEGRAGRDGMYGPMRVLIYGDESHHSTGELSGHIVLAGIRSCRERSKDHLIYWDEPDIGMGENEAAGSGQVIREFVENLPEKTRAVFITSHSRPLVSELASLRPHYVHLGVDAREAPQSLQEWLERPVVPLRPDAVSEASRARFKAIQAIINKNKES